MITYKNGILSECNGYIKIRVGTLSFSPSKETRIFDICIENYDEYLLVYYKRYFYDWFYDGVEYPDIENPELYCPSKFKTYTKYDMFKRNPREIKYLEEWVRLKKVEERLMKLFNKNLIVIE